MSNQSINERFRMLRLELGLSQTAFGEPIGLSRSEVKNIEYDKTEPKQLTIPIICRQFNVSEVWLRTGEGDMFNDVDAEQELTDVLAEIAVSDDDLIKRIIRAYWDLDEKEKAAIRKLIDGFSQK